MQDTAPSSTTPRALFRAWQATVTYRECGTVTDVQTYTVTMSRTAQGVTATLNGRPADVLAAARILSSAQSENALTVTAEILDTPSTPARAIGKGSHESWSGKWRLAFFPAGISLITGFQGCRTVEYGSPGPASRVVMRHLSQDSCPMASGSTLKFA